MRAGDQVRLIHNPSKIGIFTGKERGINKRTKLQVKFPDQGIIQYIPKAQLEKLPEVNEAPIDLFEQGRFSSIKDLRRVLSQVRLNGKLIDMIYSMEISNTDFMAYQYKPVLKILNSPNNGILIADEVGLGKTIESGLIWTELKSRFDAQNILVVVPAVLREKWELELKNRFGIEAEIVDGDGLYKRLNEIQNSAIYKTNALIASIQGIRINDQLIDFLDNIEFQTPLIDCLVVDEAHYMRNPETKTAKIISRLRTASDYIILLTATPIQLRSDDLFNLVKHIDPSTFESQRSFEAILSANQPIMEARDLVQKKQSNSMEILGKLIAAQEHSILEENKQLDAIMKKVVSHENPPIEIRSKLAADLDSLNLFSNTINRTRKRDVKEWKVYREPFAIAIPMSKYESEFYENVTKTVRDFCQKYEKHEGFLLTTPQRVMSSSMAAALHSWKQRIDIEDDFDYDKYGRDPQIKPLGDLGKELINKLYQYGIKDELYYNDSKYNKLLTIIKQLIKDNKKEKIILFSTFRPTLYYLQQRLIKDGFNCRLIIGGMKESKFDVIDNFQNDERINILLSSEVGSEGIDLQFSRVIINYDLPWNPMRIEQRIGRLDRIGQKNDKIKIFNFFYDDTIDSRIYKRLLNRLDIFRQALGDLEEILGDIISDLSYKLLNTRLTAEQETERIDQTRMAVENIKIQNEELEKEAIYLVAHGDYILNQVKTAHELNRWIKSSDIQDYVISFFNQYYPDCEFIQSENEKVFKIRLSNEAQNDLERFLNNSRLPKTTNLIRVSKKTFEYIFENKVIVDTRKYIEVINQVHPLIRFINARYTESDVQQFPTVALHLEANEIQKSKYERGIYLFSVNKWIFIGLQNIEKLNYICYYLDGKKSLSETESEILVHACLEKAQDYYQAINDFEFESLSTIMEEECLDRTIEKFDEYYEELIIKNNDRANIQEQNLINYYNINKEQLKSLIHRLKIENKMQGAKLNMRKLDALENRVERRKIEINNGRNIAYDNVNIAMGLIKIF